MASPALVAAVSHAIGAAVFAGFATLLLANGRVRERHRILLAACLLTTAWCAAVAVQEWAVDGDRLAQLTRVLEALRSVAWLVFLALLLAPAGLPVKRVLAIVAVLATVQMAAGELAPLAQAPTGSAVVAPAAGVVTSAADPLAEPLANQATMATIVASLLLAVLGVLLVEQLFRSTPARERWGIKFACLGLGTLFMYDFYLYSDALLFRRIRPEIWAARGLVDAFCVPMLAVAAARNPDWKLGLALSRKMMLGSAALVGCAAYLLAMAAGGWYLRSIGGAWGPVMQLACLFGAGLLLAGLLFSGSVRARLRVFISKHFYQAHFDYRDEWRRFTQALSEGGPAPGERAIQAIGAIVESPAGALWIGRDGEHQPVAHWNLPPQGGVEPVDSEFCRYLEERHWVVRASGHGSDDVPVPAWLHGVPGLWLVVPLMLHGRLFGFVALSSPRTAVTLNWEVYDLLRLAGSQAASCLAHGELAERLAVARQFESFNRMSTFVVHDLKNLLSQHALLLANAERHKANPAFQEDMLATLAHSMHKMTALLQRLSHGDHAATRLPLSLSLAQVAKQAAQPYTTVPQRLTLDLPDEPLQVEGDVRQLERVLSHLLQNAVEATPPDGRIALSLRRQEDCAVLEVRDSGVGMSAAFVRDRLFRPFETTKTAGMGIGVYESREAVRELGGRLDVESKPGSGTTFRIVLPLRSTGSAVLTA